MSLVTASIRDLAMRAILARTASVLKPSPVSIVDLFNRKYGRLLLCH